MIFQNIPAILTSVGQPAMCRRLQILNSTFSIQSTTILLPLVPCQLLYSIDQVMVFSITLKLMILTIKFLKKKSLNKYNI